MALTAPTRDVTVIGAGIVGIAIAYTLQAEGRSVLLIDRKGIAEEASYGNAGAFAFSDILPLASPGVIAKTPRWLLDPVGPLSIPPGYLPSIAPWLVRFWLASRSARVRENTIAQTGLMRLAASEMASLAARSGIARFVRSDGALELYESRMEFENSLPGWAAREEAGIDYQHVTGKALADLQPGLSPHFHSGTYVPAWQNVTDPYEFAKALAESAIQKGVTFQLGDIAGLLPLENGAEVIASGGERIRCRNAVVACGAWSKPLARLLDDKIPLETERGYNTTLPIDAFPLQRQLIFGGHGFVITLLTSGIRVGGAVELGGLTRPPNFNRSKAMLAKAARFLPGLRIEGGREWMGFRPSMPDSLPVIGRSRRSSHIVYAFGHGHLGLTQSAGTARLVADMLAGRASAISLEPFRPDRF